jgi:hypothetical protein
LTGYALCLVLYAGGALALANNAYDPVPAVRRIVTIVDARRTWGKGASAFLTLSVPPSGRTSAEVHVPFDLYRRHPVQDPVCLVEHAGTLGWPRIQVDDAAACNAR